MNQTINQLPAVPPDDLQKLREELQKIGATTEEDLLRVIYAQGAANGQLIHEVEKRDNEIVAVMVGLSPVTEALGLDEEEQELTDSDKEKIEEIAKKIDADPAKKAKVMERLLMLNTNYPIFKEKYFITLSEQPEKEVEHELYAAHTGPKRTAMMKEDRPYEWMLNQDATAEYMAGKLSWTGMLSGLAKKAMDAGRIIDEIKKLKDLTIYFDIFKNRYGQRITTELEQRKAERNKQLIAGALDRFR